jgi:phage head maturation protease
MFESPKTSLGDEALESIRRKDVLGSSFAFTVKEDKWEIQPDGSYIRTILAFDRLYDCSIVYTPAYSDTSVAVRSLNDIKEQKNKEVEKEILAKELEYRKELDEYFKNLKESIE